ncbi:MAG: hypothetical protein KDD41_08710, partial [Flavobacteriales bacterium]|nr:hypothetical protein [Flavobacteriales bacterium]
RNGKFDNKNEPGGINHKDNLGHIFNRLNEPEHLNKPLLIHFHGGLVNEQAGMTVATNLTTDYTEASAYPLFFVWESGLGETVFRNLEEALRDQITTVSKDKLFKKLLPLLKNFVVSKVKTGLEEGFTRGTSEIPVTDPSLVEGLLDDLDNQVTEDADCLMLEEEDSEFKQLEQMISDDPGVSQAIDEIRQGLLNKNKDEISRGELNKEYATLVSKDVLAIIKEESEKVEEEERGLFISWKLIKYLTKIAVAVFKRYRKGTHHGFRLTLTEELLRSVYIDHIGTFVWHNMKKDTADAFGNDKDVYAGTALINHLKTWPANRRIVLVGHSTGAVYICNLLKQCDLQQLNPNIKFDVVFLAGACNFDLMADVVRNHAARINNIRTFGMQDALEKTDGIVPILYPASLLYFVSAMLEGTEDEDIDKPIVGMQRYFADRKPFNTNDNIQVVKDFLNGKTYWSECNEGPGKTSMSHKHGDFDNSGCETIKSVKHIISNGY